MNSTIKLICVLLLLPCIAAIGHDFYLNYMSDPEKQAKLEALDVDPALYQVSDLGYLAVHYTPGIYDYAKSSVSEESWKAFVDPVLQQYTFVVAAIPAAVLYLYLLIARILHFAPFSANTSFRPEGKRRSGETKGKDGSGGNGDFKYKRR